jgi:hypothetical protein
MSEQRFEEIWDDAIKQFEASTDSKLLLDDSITKAQSIAHIHSMMEELRNQAQTSGNERSNRLKDLLMPILTVIGKISETAGEAIALVRICGANFVQRGTCSCKIRCFQQLKQSQSASGFSSRYVVVHINAAGRGRLSQPFHPQTAKKVKSTSDTIESILESFKNYFDRLSVHLGHEIHPKLERNIVESLALFLRIIGLSKKLIEQSPMS